MGLGRWTLALLLLASVVLGTNSCRFDSPSAETKTPPLFLRATVPADSAMGLGDGTAMNLVLEFNRSAEPDRVRLRFFPALEDPASPPVAAARSLVWSGIELDTDVLAYRVLIDSPDMPRPELITLFPGGPGGKYGRIRGRVRVPQWLPEGEDTLVLALRARPPQLPPLHLERIFGLTVESASLSQGLPNVADAVYDLVFLRHPTQYVVLAIHDTSGDGLYDVESDWWGLPRERGLIWTPFAVADTFQCEPAAIDIDLQAPGTLQYVEPPEQYDPQPYCGGELQN